MQGLAGSVPLVIILAVGVCAPLAGWLAMQRARNPILWFAYGALTGPIALLLLVASPVGRCPSCDTPARGWSGSCVRCRAPLGGVLAGWSADGTSRAGAPPEGLTQGGAAMAHSTTAHSTVVQATSAPVNRVLAADPTAGGDGSSAGPASTGEVLSTAVYLSGNAGLEIGACYAIARVEDRIRVFGPVDTGQLTVRHERPIDEGEVVAIDDRIILTLRSGRSSTSMVMRWVGGMQPAGLETALAPGAREGQPTDGLWR